MSARRNPCPDGDRSPVAETIIGIVFDDLFTQEWQGIVLSMWREAGSEDLLNTLVSERQRVGGLILWQFQSFRHHEHPFFGNDDHVLVAEQNAARASLKEHLMTRHPNSPFVIETDWFSQTTWFQATSDAELVSGQWKALSSHWFVKMDGLQEMSPEERRREVAERTRLAKLTAGKGRERMCPHCFVSEWSDGWEEQSTPGILWMKCEKCGLSVVESTRVWRERIGPEGMFNVPDLTN